jgi:uncharacterized protein
MQLTPADLLELSPPRLRGARCAACAEVIFPAVQDCPNCMATDSMRPYLLAGHGVLQDFVLAERGPAGFDVPYLQAYVKLDDGPVVFTLIDVPDPAGAKLAIGEPMTMTVGPVASPSSTVLGWRFAPDGVKS